MKRTTQLSIVVEHRRVAFSLTGAADTAPHPSAGDGPGAAAIDRALQQHGLHTHLSPAGQLSICSKSLEGIQENL